MIIFKGLSNFPLKAAVAKQRSIKLLTWEAEDVPSGDWRCWPVIFLSPVPLAGLDLLCSLQLSANPVFPDPRLFAWMSWALIRSFCLFSPAISAIMALGEGRRTGWLEGSDNEETDWRLMRAEVETWDWTFSQEPWVSDGERRRCRGNAWPIGEEGKE